MQGATPGIVRADSWALQAGPPNALLHSASDAQRQDLAMSYGFPASFKSSGGALKPPSSAKLEVSEPLPRSKASPQQRTASTDSASTAQRLAQQPGGAAASLPMRQISLDVIAAEEAKRMASVERPNPMFHDVLEQLGAKEEALSSAAGLYTLPSLQFLEALLDDIDSRGPPGSAEPPLHLPEDAFDLPSDSRRASPGGLMPTPFDTLLRQPSAAGGPPPSHMGRAHSAAALGASPPGMRAALPAYASAPLPAGHQYSVSGGPMFTVQAAALASQPVAEPAPIGAFVPTGQPVAQAPSPGAVDPRYLKKSMHVPAPSYMGSPGMSAAGSLAHHAGSPGRPRLSAGGRGGAQRRRSMYDDIDEDYEEPEFSVQASKSGRVRKVASFVGVKRRASSEVSSPMHFAPRPSAARLAATAEGGPGGALPADSAELGSMHSMGADSADEGSRGSKGARKVAKLGKGKGRRTTCLNCGCHQTPQWRCGPLGPRTLCNACGVRYKKGLPLNCWPIREGMVLPPGAVLPPDVHIPPGINIILQPAESE